MAPPINFDPAGRCVLLIGDEESAYLFHGEILGKASRKLDEMLRHCNFSNTDEDVDERPLELYAFVPDSVLKLLKQWAYRGDIDNCELTMGDLLEALKANTAELCIDGFQDALVDKAIKTMVYPTWWTIIDEVREYVLAQLPSWPAQFYDFFLDWVVRWDQPEMLQAVEEHLLQGKLPPQLQHDFIIRSLQGRKMAESRRQGDLSWLTAPCRYHSHAEGKGCYKIAGAIDVSRREADAMEMVDKVDDLAPNSSATSPGFVPLAP